MTETFTKTVKLRLREPTKKKGKKLQSFGSGKDSGIKFWTKANHRRTDSDGI